MESEGDGGTGEEGEEVLEEMELEETVEEDEKKEEGEEEVVGDWNEGESLKEERVGGGRRGPIQIHGREEPTQKHFGLFNRNLAMVVS